MAITLSRPPSLRTFVVSLSLAFVACSSAGASDGPMIDDAEQIDDPKPGVGGAGPSEPDASGDAGSEASEPEPASGGKAGGGSTEEEEPAAGAPSEPTPGAGGAPIEGPSEPEPPPPSEAELRGAALVKDNGCVSCHQENFAGFSVFPNITPDLESGIGRWSDEQIIDAIRDGIDADGASMCPTMARYPFSDEQAADVVVFLRALAPVTSKAASACPGHG